jgi:hypothetical protein
MIRAALEPRSNRETFTENIELFRDDQQLDLIGVTAKIQLERADAPYNRLWDYQSYQWYDYLGTAAKLLATTENGGASIVGGGAIRFVFTPAQMQTLMAGQYRLSAIATSADGTMTKQLFQFQIPILDGGVPTQ